MSDANRRLAAWMAFNMDAKTGKRGKLSQNQVARETGLGVSTINRYCDANDTHEPRHSNVMVLSQYFEASPPLDFPEAPDLRGFSEDGVTPIKPENTEGWDANLSEWTVRDHSMQVKGYLPGDVVKADARIQPVDGDVVVCNLYSIDGSKARTALRMFKAPNYLMPTTTDARTLEIHEAGKTAAIFGVIYEMKRSRTLA